MTRAQESQLGELSSKFRQMELMLSESRAENSSLATALDGARELNAKLQSHADQSTREIALHIDQSHNQEEMAEELRQEVVLLKQKVLKSEDTVGTLEHALKKLREEHFEKDMIQVRKVSSVVIIINYLL